LAGYNGGYGVMAGGWGTWVHETQRYYDWGASIYLDALYSHASSAALQSWLDAGGIILCRQAATRLATLTAPDISVK